MDQEDGPSGRWYLVLVVGAIILSGGISFFLKGGYGDVSDLKQEINQLRAENKRLRKTLENLEIRRTRLQSDPYMIESLARKRLGYTMPGEKRIKFPTFSPSSSVEKQDDEDQRPTPFKGPQN